MRGGCRVEAGHPPLFVQAVSTVADRALPRAGQHCRHVGGSDAKDRTGTDRRRAEPVVDDRPLTSVNGAAFAQDRDGFGAPWNCVAPLGL